MANYSNLAATINAQIRANGVQAITGPVLNAVLTAMVNVLGDGYRLNGVAVPAGNPGSPDNRVAYLAAQDGTYTNFGGLTISGEVALLLWDSAWTKETLFSIDTAVTPGSGNLVTSGAVDSALTTLANNIAAAYMQLVPAATEGNLAEFDNAGQVRDAGLATSDLATKDGHYPDLFAGFAGNLVDTRSVGTHQSFAFRQSGGDGVNYMRKILGRTEAWNQIFDNKATPTFNITAGASYPAMAEAQSAYDIVAGHDYLAIVSIELTSGTMPTDLYFTWKQTGDFRITPNVPKIITSTQDSHINANTGSLRVYSGAVDACAGTCKVTLVDLTLEGLGLTTADQFRALHPLPYYSYNAGVLKNNAATGLETRGFNQWDEVAELGGYSSVDGSKTTTTTTIRSANKIRVTPATNYYILAPSGCWVYCWDADGNFITKVSGNNNYIVVNTSGVITTPANCYYIAIQCFTDYGTTYNHDICINLSDASRNGEYEPYWERTLALGLNSLPCHDEDNNAVVVNGLDGVGTSQDELIVENGWGTKINKVMEEVDLGDLNWDSGGGTSVVGATRFRVQNMDAKALADNNTIPNCISTKYLAATANATYTGATGICANGSTLYLYDPAFNSYTAAQVKAALAGVKLRFELATPKVLTLDNPIPALIEVDNLGTEKRLPEDTADNPQGPFECDSNYSVSTANLVRLLNS